MIVSKVITNTEMFSDWVTQAIQDHTIKTCNKVFRGVVDNSPVLTGSFRASWTMSKNEPKFEYNKGGSKDAPQPPPKLPILRYAKKEFPLVYIANGSPYADRIEHGWSQKAPYGVVNLTLVSLGI